MSVRQERMILADSRAMEEQKERENPINPKKQIGSRKGYTGILRGSGATPSMGLSQYRGGAVQKTEMKEEASDTDDEPTSLGIHLGRHLLGTHGDDYHSKFLSGMGRAKKAENVHLKGGAIVGGGMSECGTEEGSGMTGAYEGEGVLKITHSGEGLLGEKGKGTKKGMERKTARLAFEKTDGSGLLGEKGKGTKQAVMLGEGKKRRAVGENDGRRKRAEVVRKVMAEKGMKMIEASKYVKEHNLY